MPSDRLSPSLEKNLFEIINSQGGFDTSAVDLALEELNDNFFYRKMPIFLYRELDYSQNGNILRIYLKNIEDKQLHFTINKNIYKSFWMPSRFLKVNDEFFFVGSLYQEINSFLKSKKILETQNVFKAYFIYIKYKNKSEYQNEYENFIYNCKKESHKEKNLTILDKILQFFGKG